MKRLIVVLTLLLASTEAEAQDRPEVTFVPMAQWKYHNLLAVVECDSAGEPQILMRDTLRNSAKFPSVLAHERIHIRQIREYSGGCKSFENVYQASPMFRLTVEAEAYCVQVRTDGKNLAEQDAVRETVNALMRFYGPQAGYREDLSPMVREACAKNPGREPPP